MSSLFKKVINIDKNSRSQTAIESVWPVSKLSTESVGSRRELVANCVHTADAMQLGSCVASAVCGLLGITLNRRCMHGALSQKFTICGVSPCLVPQDLGANFGDLEAKSKI